MTNLQISPQEAAQELLRRREARKNLLKFTEYTNPSYQTARHHELICKALEAFSSGDLDRLMIFMPPRHGKSELASRRFPAWFLGNYPDNQIIAASYNSELASDFGRDVRNIVGSPEYHKLFGICLSADSHAANRWHTDRGGMYVAAGVGTAITGRGAHRALIDDPFKDAEEADSEVTRDKVWNWYSSTFYTRLMPRGGICLIQTRWNDDDLAARLLNEESNGGDKWHVLELPALKNNEALWPEWYPLEALERIKANLPARYWNALYQQNPIPEDGDYFKKDWFQRYRELPKHLNLYITHDDAVTEEESGKDPDWTELAVWGVSADDDVYALNWVSRRTTADIWVDDLIDLMDKYGPFVTVGEGGVIRRAVEPFLEKRMWQRKVYSRLEWLPSITDKSARARAFQGLASMKKVYFPYTDWAEDVISQLLRFPAGVHDDKVDACSLIGRSINQTFAPKLPKPKEPVSILKRPTLDELINMKPKRARTGRI